MLKEYYRRKSDVFIEHVKKYVQVSHTNTKGQFRVCIRKLGLFSDQIIGGGWGMGRFSLTVV